MRSLLGIALVVAVLVPGMISTAAQNQTLKFEVASVKPAKGDAPFAGTCRGKDYPVNPALPTPPPLGTCLMAGLPSSISRKRWST